MQVRRGFMPVSYTHLDVYKRQEATCVPYENADLAAQLDEAVANIHGEITEYEACLLYTSR